MPLYNKKKYDKNSRENIVFTVNSPECFVALIDEFVEYGFYYSRCDFVREAIKEKLTRERENYEKIVKPLIDTDDPNTIRIPNKDGTYKTVRRIGVG